MYSKQYFYTALVLMLGALFAVGTASAVAEPPTRVVYHIDFDDPRRQQHALRMMQNHLDAAGEQLELLVVVHGLGMSLLLKPEAFAETQGFRHANAGQGLRYQIDALRLQGVRFLVCGSTLKNHAVNREKHLHDVDSKDVVTNGVMQLIDLQTTGYAYLKP